MTSPILKWIERNVQDSRPQLKYFPRKQFFSGRKTAPKDAYFAGLNALTGEKIFLPDENRMEHTQIVGVTGGGKTEGGIVPALIHDIIRGRGAAVIDMKGDRSLLEKISAAVVATGREKDFYFFSLSDPKRSHTYNPLRRGNASEVKDKIISAQVWSEVYYKKTSEIATLQLCHALRQLGEEITFHRLLSLMRDLKSIDKLRQQLDALKINHELTSLLSVLDGKTRDLSGLMADFTAMVGSEFGDLLAHGKGEIDLLDIYQNRKIVLFQLHTGLYQETAIRLARMIIQDIKSVSNAIQAYTVAADRQFFGLYIDEFASIAFEAFIELLNKARSSKIAISIAHQSLGDLAQVSEGFQSQIFDNTNTRMVFRQNSATSRDLITKMGGTIEVEKFTHQTEHDGRQESFTGRGSSRRVETFQIDPNIITELQTGYCVLVQHKRTGKDRITYMQSDYLDIGCEADFLKQRLQEEPEAPLVEVFEEVGSNDKLDSLKRRIAYYQ